MLTASISWNYSLADNTGFLLQRSTDLGSIWTINYPTPASQTSYLDMTIEPYVTYSYHVAPTNQYGTGSWSNMASITFTRGDGNPPAGTPGISGSIGATPLGIPNISGSVSQ